MFILLDIDGVMVAANSWKRPEFLNDGFPAFSLRATNALNRIIVETGATIILTTSHKSSYEIADWKNMFKTRGIIVNEIERLAENINYQNRKDEILSWFNSADIEELFVIIDDDKSLNALPEVLKSKLVQTSASVGLTDELANNAIAILSSELVY